MQQSEALAFEFTVISTSTPVQGEDELAPTALALSAAEALEDTAYRIDTQQAAASTEQEEPQLLDPLAATPGQAASSSLLASTSVPDEAFPTSVELQAEITPGANRAPSD
jgi:hypothetical protein